MVLIEFGIRFNPSAWGGLCVYPMDSLRVQHDNPCEMKQSEFLRPCFIQSRGDHLKTMFKRFALSSLLAFALVALWLTPAFGAEDFPPPKSLGDLGGRGRNVQRTMRLLAESTPEHRNTMRILFYGQSITEQGWWKLVADDLRKRYPNANLIIENRALGGFASQMLVKTAETDLYPFQPDLLIFQVYGAHDKYEDIIRRTRERTTAEILQQNDHVTKPEAFSEETDPAKLPPKGTHWDAFMNHNWLPSLAKKYGTEFCDQRAIWKQYLKDYNLEPKVLLKDGVHLNAHGEFLMAECVKSYLRYDSALGPAPAEAWIKTLTVGKDITWKDGKLRVEFSGTRVDLIAKQGSAPSAAVRIDGKKPSEFQELYGFTRALSKPGGKWPPIAPIQSQALLLLEDWTLDAQKDPVDAKVYSFKLSGSKTGADGEGRSDQRFVSTSGRIVISSESWNVEFALMLSGVKPAPDKFTAKWTVVPNFVDDYAVPKIEPGIEAAVTIAQGLSNTKHVLEIEGGEAVPISAVRIHSPPLGK